MRKNNGRNRDQHVPFQVELRESPSWFVCAQRKCVIKEFKLFMEALSKK